MTVRTLSLVGAFSLALALGGCGDSTDPEAACNTGVCAENSIVMNACIEAVELCRNNGGSASQCADAARQACSSAND